MAAATPAAQAHDLEGIIDALADVDMSDGRVAIGDVIELFGSRSFGPMLVLCGLVLWTPISGIPGVATVMGAIGALVGVQMLLGRKRFWIPRWLAKRSVSRERFCKSLKRAHKMAHVLDHALAERLRFIVRTPIVRILAGACVLSGLAMPALEMVPFADTIPGTAMLLFGLGVLADDGLMALVAGFLWTGTAGLVAWTLLGGAG